MAGIYLHIPFCESRCIYCGFYSTTSLSLRSDYVEALCHEMALRPVEKALGSLQPIETVYLGGGTPSQLLPGQLQQLFDELQEHYLAANSVPAEKMEITMECNPDDVTEELCRTLSHLPVNRISMGAQTFSDQRLKFLHRRHTARQVKEAVERLRTVGIHNISIDLMFGFPGETLQDWQEDLREALSLGVEHISAYSLMIEEGTALQRMMEREHISEPDEEVSLSMYDMLIDRLTEAGYEHYEISNFARPGFRSRHNSSYWHEVPYIGLGAAAHSYTGTERSWNVESVQQYITSIQSGILPSEAEKLSLPTRFDDLITTALRTREGIDLEKARKEYGEDIYRHLLKEAEEKCRRGTMQITQGRLSLTRAGLYISDDIMSDFMIGEE